MVTNWHSRGYLPHFEGGERAQFVTFRLHDSLPQVLLERWQRELARNNHHDLDAALRKRIETYLDEGHGDAYFRDERIARLMQDAMLHFDGERYRLAAWVVMPNHVHLLATPRDGFTLSSIMHSLKSFTAKEANKLLKRTGVFWQAEYFDRYIRDAKHFAAVVAYIENNPVKAKLCPLPHQWKFSSASAGSKAGSKAGSASAGSAGVPPAMSAKRESEASDSRDEQDNHDS